MKTTLLYFTLLALLMHNIYCQNGGVDDDGDDVTINVEQQNQPQGARVLQQQPTGPEPAAGEELEDEPGSGPQSFFLDMQQAPGPEPAAGEELEDEPAESGASSFQSAQQRCVQCPRFLRRCRCRFFEDCRYIRRTCFTCPRWRCRRRRFDGGFGGGRGPRLEV